MAHVVFFTTWCCSRVLVIISVEMIHFYSYLWKNECFAAKQKLFPKKTRNLCSRVSWRWQRKEKRGVLWNWHVFGNLILISDCLDFSVLQAVFRFGVLCWNLSCVVIGGNYIYSCSGECPAVPMIKGPYVPSVFSFLIFFHLFEKWETVTEMLDLILYLTFSAAVWFPH